ncbi:hypothetical protein [Pseudomonas sp. UBA6310]|uniref:hypothetical protein n=1 Tax=Pseudomonas sp. UBA6310 TaxID=1947327 RepID=UPI00257F5E4E|nr:hypothetical protein [Pseudomonas sp. UBA6310]
MRYPIIEQHGAKEGMTGSCRQLHMSDASSLLVDCRLFQSNGAYKAVTARAD